MTLLTMGFHAPPWEGGRPLGLARSVAEGELGAGCLHLELLEGGPVEVALR